MVAGFQGVSQGGEITTLGRGGSDVTAVALAATFRSKRVEFYKDVSGIYNKDPKILRMRSIIPSLALIRLLR